MLRVPKQLGDIYTHVGKSVTSLDVCGESELSLNGVAHGICCDENSALFRLSQIVEKAERGYCKGTLVC